MSKWPSLWYLGMAGLPDIAKQIQPIGSISMVCKVTGLPWVLIHMHPANTSYGVIHVTEEEIWIQET